MKKVIHVDISSGAGIAAAIADIEAYRRWVIEKIEELRRRVAFLIATTSQAIFSSAIADDLVNEGYVIGGVEVTVKHEGDNVTMVIASGKDAIFMEFGAGVFYNGYIGNSPNPWGENFGYYIGSFGEGNGEKRVWAFKDENGKMHLSHGTPASMPLYKTVMAVHRNIAQIVKEVFSA